MIMVLKKVDEDAYIIAANGSLKNMQEIVGGNIEVITLQDGICMVCNEEGKLAGLKPNFLLPFANDFVVGDVIFASTSGEEFTSITLDQVAEIASWFN